ncbi:MAG: winged helix-turn-helix domain-containing protein [Anaerolineae bacterium]
MQVKANVWIERDGQVALSRWRVALLLAVQETGSISAAAQRLNIPYHRAWDKIRECERCLGVPLLTTQTGGLGGGGARLTPAAIDYIQRFRQFDCGLDELIQQRFQAAFGDLLSQSDELSIPRRETCANHPTR